MANSKRFHGIFTALVTPMHEDGGVDHPSLVKLVQHQIEHGIHGFYVGGSTGEGFLMTREERKQVLETVIQATGGKARVVAHIGSMSTMESVELAQHAEAAGAEAVSAVVPFYYKVGAREIQKHYETIMVATKLPMIIYHFPGATGVQLSLGFYEEMAKHPQCIGVKFTSLNLFEMEQIRSRCGDDFLIWNGHDEVFAGGALIAADGAVGSTMNMMPSLYTDMYTSIQGGQWEEVRSLQSKANVVISHLVNYDVIPYEKYVLYKQGIISTPTARQPLRQFTSEENEQIHRFLQSNEILSRHSKVNNHS